MKGMKGGKSVPVKGTSPKVSKAETGGFKGGHGPKGRGAAPYGCDKTHKKKSQ